MKDVDFPVLGMDEYGNKQLMLPGNDYKFPGNTVLEVPMKQYGGLGATYILPNRQQFQQTINNLQPRSLTREEVLQRINQSQQNAQESTRNVVSRLVTPEQRSEAFYNTETEQRKRRLADAELANNEDLTTSDNWQQLLMRQSQAIGDKFHSDYIPDWINPFVMVGDMASGLGAVPYNIQQGNYGSAALGVASPLAAGALGSLGAKTTGQFLNNVANPFVDAFDAYKLRRDLNNAFKKSYGRTADLSEYQISKIPSVFEITAKPTAFIKDLALGADNIENIVKERIAKLRTPEGMNRLVEQEKEYLQSIGFQGNLNKQAYNNANARLIELDNIGSTNIDSRKYLEENIHSNTPDQLEKIQDYDLLRHNAFYKKPHVTTIEDYHGLTPLAGGRISIGKPYLYNKPVIHHEFAHSLQRGRVLPADTELLQIVPKFSMTNKEYADFDYFLGNNNYTPEPTAFANELRSAMLERGYIKDLYEPINESLLRDAYKKFAKKPLGIRVQGDENNFFLSNHRLFDFMEPSSQNFQILSNVMNKLPSAIPIGVGTVGTYNAIQTNKNKFGGNINYNNMKTIKRNKGNDIDMYQPGGQFQFAPGMENQMHPVLKVPYGQLYTWLMKELNNPNTTIDQQTLQYYANELDKVKVKNDVKNGLSATYIHSTNNALKPFNQPHGFVPPNINDGYSKMPQFKQAVQENKSLEPHALSRQEILNRINNNQPQNAQLSTYNPKKPGPTVITRETLATNSTPLSDTPAVAPTPKIDANFLRDAFLSSGASMTAVKEQVIPAIKQQVNKDDVTRLQRQLNKYTGAGLKDDGIWGPKTQKAVEDYLSNMQHQAMINQDLKQLPGAKLLKVDGIIGEKTKAANDIVMKAMYETRKKELAALPETHPPLIDENQINNVNNIPSQEIVDSGTYDPAMVSMKPNQIPAEEIFAYGGMMYGDMFNMVPRNAPHLFYQNGGNYMDPATASLMGLGLVNSLMTRAPYERRKMQRNIINMNNAGAGVSNNSMSPFGNYTLNSGPGGNFQLNNLGQTQDLGTTFQEGGEYELTDDQIQQILRNGGRVEYL
jgi:hypothetical protein